MIVTTIPEINVSELMARVRERAAEMKRIEEHVALPAVADVVPLPPAALPKPVDARRERLLEMVQHARGKLRVSRWIPKPLRQLFVRQGSYNVTVLDAITSLAKTNAELADRVQQLTACVAVQQDWAERRDRQSPDQRAWREAAAEGLRATSARVHECQAVLRETRDQVGGLRLQVEANAEELQALQSTAERLAADKPAVAIAELGAAVSRLDDRQASEGAYARAELSQLRAEIQRRVDSAPAAAQAAEGVPSEPSSRLDAFYLGFENRFRGPRSEIKQRLSSYLPLVREVGAGTPERPILDLGCGRGEWLELLKDEQLNASGIDLNAAMVAECRQRLLDVTRQDAIAHLRSWPAGNAGAVSGFHIIEHVALETLMDLFAETWRVLAPGGVAIFESPNCKNVVVGACNFYSDPTHRNPVFPDTAAWMLQTHGFEPVRVEYLSPVTGSPFNRETPDGALLDNWFYGPRDFAVIGYKPAAA